MAYPLATSIYTMGNKVILWIFSFFVIYQCGKRLYQAELQKRGTANDDSAMLTVLALFFWIVSLAIIQHKLNTFNSFDDFNQPHTV